MRSLAVVDTNVLVSALLKPGSVPAAVMLAVRQGTMAPVVCNEIIAEYRAVLQRPRLLLPARDVADLLSLFEAQARWVRITPYLTALKLPDANDWPFIACALAADCPVITGNSKHFPKAAGVVAFTPAQWVAAQEGR